MDASVTVLRPTNGFLIQTTRKRDGVTFQDFDLSKLRRAVSSAWLAALGSVNESEVSSVLNTVLHSISTEVVDVETVQDAVETSLMKHKQFAVAKAYILYRHKRQEARLLRSKAVDQKGLSDYIHAGKYARYLPELQRREVYEETVARVEGMHISRYPVLESEIKEAFDLVRAKKVLPSMRSMQFGGAAVLSNHNRLYNCSFSFVDRLEVFSEALFLLLSGCGVGYSVQFSHVERLPAIGYVDPKKVRHHVIGDTIEGWADALKALIQSFQDGVNLEFSYHLIRDAGTTLKTSGGRAPGHLKLKESLDQIRGVLSASQGRKLRPIECHRIMCHAADAVLSGGIRRSAMISLFSFDDSEMAFCKTGSWYKNDPWFSNANNSVVLKRDEISRSQFKRFFNMIRDWGEPGFYFTASHDYGTNPCFHPDTRLWTSEGYVRVEDLYKSGVTNQVVADNRPGKGSVVSSLEGVRLLPATPVRLTQKNAEIFELVTEHGYRLKVTDRHEFPTVEGRKELRDLTIGEKLFLPSGEGSFGVGGTQDEGLLLGMYVGDGTSAHEDKEAFVDIWEPDFDVLGSVGSYMNSIVTKIPTNNGARDYGQIVWMDNKTTEGGVHKKRMGGVRFYRWLASQSNGEQVRSLKERVPDSVWKGSRDFVAGYLRGLFFADGTVLLGGEDKKATLSLRFSQANRGLLEDVQVLLSMFGVVSRVYSRVPAGYRDLPDGHGGRQAFWCEETFELVINRPNAITFKDRVGIFGRKKDVLDSYLAIRGEDCRKPERFISKIVSIRSVGHSDVYCLTQPETNVVTANGVVTGQCCEIGLDPKLIVTEELAAKLAAKGVEAEIGTTKTGWAFCNLCEINAAKFSSYEDFVAAAKAATLIGTLQATYTEMPYLGWVSESLAERDALLGIGMTGMLDAPHIACDADQQRQVAGMVRDWNAEYAKRLGINAAARTTCVKPSGTTSLELGCVGSGHHAHHARRYIRRVTADELEFVFQAFKAVNPHMCVRKPDGKWVIEFPVEAPQGATIKDDLGAIQFLNMVKSTQQNWVLPGTANNTTSPGLNHNVSNTVTVRPDEWEAVEDYLWENRNYFTGVSLLPSTGDKDYAFAPNEAVTTPADEHRWNELVSLYQPVDYTSLVEASDSTDLAGEVACAGGVCLVV